LWTLKLLNSKHFHRGWPRKPHEHRSNSEIGEVSIEDLLHKSEVNMPPRYWWGKKAKVLKSFGEQKNFRPYAENETFKKI
jgi:hypothetical protein